MAGEDKRSSSSSHRGDVGQADTLTSSSMRNRAGGFTHVPDDTEPRIPSRLDLAGGTILGGVYRIERLLGRGGMGAVYVAEHVGLRKRFAVKVVGSVTDEQLSADSVRRLVNEARTASAIDHENIVAVTHLGQTEEGLVFIVMELLRGEDLRGRLDERAAAAGRGQGDAWLPDEEVATIARQMLAGLEAAHGAGIIHRDLKPENVYLSRRGGKRLVKLVDFGMSKVLGEEASVRITQTGQILGTPLYMSPEQSRGDPHADHRTDIYSVGVLLYEMLIGAPPFPATTLYQCVLMHATQPPPPLEKRRPDLPPSVVEVVHRCLAKDPADRFQAAGELRQAWDTAWLQPEAPPRPTPEPAERTAERLTDPTAASLPASVPTGDPVGRRWPIVGTAVAGLLLLAGGGWWALSGAGPSQHPASDPDARPPIGAAAGPPIRPAQETGAVPRPPATPGAAATPPPVVSPAVGPVRVTVTSEPPRAALTIDGRQVGWTPVEVEIPAGEARVTTRLVRTGYRAEDLVLERDGPASVGVTLRPVRRRATGPQAPALAPR